MPQLPPDEDGYELWLRYPRCSDALVEQYAPLLDSIAIHADTPTLRAAKLELERAVPKLLGNKPSFDGSSPAGLHIVVGSALPRTLREAISHDGSNLQRKLIDATPTLGRDGYIIDRHAGSADGILIAAPTDVGALYGCFALLRALQTETKVARLSHQSKPKVELRMLNHWDNLDRTIERGYAGFSLWNWQHLPDYVSPRMRDYARALASVGLNCSVLTNVNSNARLLTEEFLVKVAALADVFRPYGVRVFLTARFSAPVELGALSSADPHLPEVQAWWKAKCDEIYRHVPDFGGFVVKANSEGQPGPQDYNRSHADGANLLAEALRGGDGIVVWRAFVYDHEVPEDRAKQANDEFEPLDGKFRDNVVVQVKNGPIDFQPREPFHPLFGAMPKTPLALEFQLTQEYLGFATHLVYLGTLFQEVLEADTWAHGEGSTVGKIVDGSLEGHAISAMAAVTNIGDERNWCGHPFAQANWYAFGRLCWDHTLSAEAIADEWLRMTFNNHPDFIRGAKELMLQSRQHCVDYMTPLGLHHIMAWSHHYGPGPWIDTGRPDWTSVYYHRATADGIGFDRTPSGSNATSQYAEPVGSRFANLQSCPEDLLLWFHHVPWDYVTASGRQLWDELCYRYHRGANAAADMQRKWAHLQPHVDAARFEHVRALLAIQAKEARWWRDACLSYFQSFSKRPIPGDLEQPEHTLEHYKNIEHHYVPGN